MDIITDELPVIETQVETAQTTERPKKSRGRPSKPDGAKTAQTGKKQKLSSRQLTGMLVIGHGLAAESFAQPALALDEREAGMIADAIVDVLQYYDFEASGKSLAWAHLIGVCATVYGMKFMAWQKTSQQAKAE